MKKNLDGEDVGDADDYVKKYLQGDYGELKDRLTVTNEGVITISAPLNKVEGVVIPKGFEHVSGTTVATGLVIKNKTDGNEFVWVPVKTGTFVRESFGDNLWNITDYAEPYEVEGYTSEREEYDAMVASVNTYGGFYIGRYEASETSPGNGIAQSKGDEYPWINISWGTSMTDVTGGAIEAARAVYPVSSANQGDAVSTLPYGVQWDATVRFLETNYPGIAADSAGKGNYSSYDEDDNYIEASIIETGSESVYSLNNIYDLAGNVAEWTMEAVSSSYRVIRGGDFYGSGSFVPVSGRNYADQDCEGDNVGFRLALYIK